jgi:hypothetical protein
MLRPYDMIIVFSTGRRILILNIASEDEYIVFSPDESNIPFRTVLKEGEYQLEYDTDNPRIVTLAGVVYTLEDYISGGTVRCNSLLPQTANEISLRDVVRTGRLPKKYEEKIVLSFKEHQMTLPTTLCRNEFHTYVVTTEDGRPIMYKAMFATIPSDVMIRVVPQSVLHVLAHEDLTSGITSGEDIVITEKGGYKKPFLYNETRKTWSRSTLKSLSKKNAMLAVFLMDKCKALDLELVRLNCGVNVTKTGVGGLTLTYADYKYYEKTLNSLRNSTPEE